MLNPSIKITTEVLNLIARIDEFKGEWKAIGNLAPERLNTLKHVATIESIGSSTRIEGVKLTDREIEQLLSGLDKKSFGTRDEKEVAGYADVMNIVFESYEDISFTINPGTPYLIIYNWPQIYGDTDELSKVSPEPYKVSPEP